MMHWQLLAFRETNTATLLPSAEALLHVTQKLTWSMSLKSWDTSTKPPLKPLMASASESMASMSRWLVGSSNSNRLGFFMQIMANTRRLCWPSLNSPILVVCILPTRQQTTTACQQTQEAVMQAVHVVQPRLLS